MLRIDTLCYRWALSRSTGADKDRIFISYRRADTRGFAVHLDDSLKGYFGQHRVFRDVGGIGAGEDFVRSIDVAMQGAGAQIVLIGPNWLAPGANGVPRLHEPGDHIAAEIEAALVADRPVFPVLVDGASMLREQDLPEKLKALSRRNAITISDERWSFDVTRLAKVLTPDVAGSLIERRLDRAKLAVVCQSLPPGEGVSSPVRVCFGPIDPHIDPHQPPGRPGA